MTINDFVKLTKGDFVACEFHRNVHDHPKTYRFNVFKIFIAKHSSKEIILQSKNNIYFNYEMFLAGKSNLQSIMLITQDEA